MKVLVVEDERITRDQLELLLKDWGYEVLTAADGNEAWEIAKDQKIRLIITDLLMPGVDGIELIKRVRGMKRDFYTYILIVTGMSDHKNLFDAMFAGADDFIVKPWHNAEVRARLRTGERVIHLEDELKDRIQKLEQANQLIQSANERMMREVAYMSRMQSTMLPSAGQDLPGLKCAWKHQPNSMLAGDGMNLFRLDENNYALIMVNVGSSGDASSYLLASLARKLVPVPGQPGILKLLSRVAQGYELVPPERVLTLLNSEFSIDLGNNKTFSVFYGIINLAESMLYYASAGNPVPIVVRQNGSLASLAGPEKPIGETADYKYKRQQVQLHNADRLCLFSEGLSNMPDHSGEPFAKRRLQEHVLRAHDSDLEAFVEYIFKTAMEWGSIDKTGQDVSLLAVEIYGAKNNGAS